MKNRIISKLFTVSLVCMIISGCSFEDYKTKQSSANSITVESLNIDNYFVKGKKLQHFDKIPSRVLVVGENETETLIELGAEKKILLAAAQNNRTYAMRPENAEKFNKIPHRNSGYVNMEYVTMLNPDLIVAQQCVITRHRLKSTDYWNNRGIPTMVPLNSNTPAKHIYEETVELEMKYIEDLGKIFRLEDNARRIVNSTYKTIDEVNEKTKNIKKPKVMFVEFLSSFICYDKTKIIGNMAEHIGAQISETPAVIGFENIIKENPEILFVVCSHVDYGKCIDKILKNKALQNLPCIKNKRVYSIPLRFTYSPQCRTEDGIRFLAEKMYPGIKFSWN